MIKIDLYLNIVPLKNKMENKVIRKATFNYKYPPDTKLHNTKGYPKHP